MLCTLIVGLGRAGLGLHVPVLLKARAQAPGAFAGRPVVAVDPRAVPTGPLQDLVIAGSLPQARDLLDPARTVVHVCTPPSVRAEVLRDVALLGFSRVVVEKPLATDRNALRRVLAVVREHGLSLSVVAPWLHSTLTERLVAVVEGGELGSVRTVSVAQHKPRFRRSLANSGHASAFDVEVPHSLGALLRLLGDAEVREASCTDLSLGESVVPRMGGARLALQHHGGACSEIVSDLTAPVRQRQITLDMTGGTVVGHYPVGQDDDFAQLETVSAGRTVREVFEDDALTSFMVRAYRRYASGPGGDDLGTHVRTVELLHDAKQLAAKSATVRGAGSEEPLTHVS
ncbi:Gfo/Idh/MocA family oxidoreductase [Streptomyces ochraceiscleroticus]|uniref:Gfo/Idh/MocA family oxidoreductase n=1 Tax=Streptomyces ochraceiscleroticus TaxID=47761 RepID=A0ABW1MT30_9ACTN|nr:Gfo/Idh/MocA family oxidoreductase [Streptomyces ochraceiscleroticus]